MKSLPLLILPLLLLAGAASASLRCDKGIISEGDRTSEVISKCGPPDNKSFVGYSSGGDRPVEEWVYSRSGGMIYFLRFEGGRLTHIDSKRGN
ncbi:DUF2845 domain-containing protein [Pseudomonas sp. LS44]|uniref:DUF2845 domain-containing protein n=1 Tax=Pseudomonas sp. LS44 TaxID=1357074 RepID=UPI00215A8BD7|nr:DUF2845 domain-containing protein [Pseudomonas sp. LS44]UVE17058.1 DUF2845 domain-containing protein [Pseudomonas sp. LS44]